MASYQPRHRKSRILPRFLWGICFAVLLAAGTIIVFRERLIEFVIVTILNQQHLGPASVDIKRANLRGIAFAAGTIADGDLRFSEATIEYSWASLQEGKIESAHITGLIVRSSWDSDGFSFGKLTFREDPSLARSPVNSSNANALPLSSQTRFPIGRFNVEKASLEISHPDGLIRTTLDLSAKVTDTAADIDATASVVGPNLNGLLNWRGTIDTIEVLNSSLVGRMEINAAGFRIPGATNRVNADIAIEAQADRGTITVSSSRDATFSGPWPDAFNSAAMSFRGGERFDVALRTSSPSSPIFSFEKSETGLRSTFDLDLNWALPLGRGTITASGWATSGANGLPQDFEFGQLRLQLDGAQTPYGTLWAQISADGLSGPIAIAGGPLSITGRLRDGMIQNLSFSEIDIASDTTFRLDGLSLAFDLVQLGIIAHDLKVGEEIVFIDPIKLGLTSTDSATQTITTVFGADGSTTLTLDTAINMDAPAVEVKLDNNALSFSTGVPILWLKGYWISSDEVLDISAKLDGGRWWSEGMEVSGISFEGHGSGNRLDGVLTAEINRSASGSRQSSGVTLKAETIYEKEILNTEGLISLPPNAELGQFSLTYDSSRGTGQVSSNIGPLSFGGDGLSPRDLRPLALPFTPTSGEFAANVVIPFGSSPNEAQSGTVFFREMEIEGGNYRVVGLNSVVTLDSVFPLKTKGSQIAAIKLLQAGLTLSDVQTSFFTTSHQAVEVETLSMSFAGGTISGEPFSLNFDGTASETTLRVSDMSLSALAESTGAIGLEASGSLSGIIPAKILGPDVSINSGNLSTSAPGYIRYRPDQTTTYMTAGNSGMTLALQALENFQYDSIAVTVSGDVQRELETALSIKGRNPELYEGYPIDFNLNLSGELASVVRDSTVGYRVPETIKRQLTAFPPAN